MRQEGEAQAGEADLLRAETGEGKEKPGFPELFFDLVFVFALIQLSHALTAHFSAVSLLQAAILLLALWWVWVQTAIVTNLLDTGREAVSLFLFALMFCGLLLAVVLPEAFGEKGLIFAAAYSAMQIGRALFSLFAHRRAEKAAFLTFLRSAIWLCFSALFWLGGGLADPAARLWLWAAAIAIEYAAPAFNHPLPGLMDGRENSALRIAGEHFAERSALFIIICLGETIMATGRTATEHMGPPIIALIFCCAFASTVLMWWLYFHDGQERAARKAENARNPQKTAESLFIYGHLPIVAGIVLTAIGEELSLRAPLRETGFVEALAIGGGPALFLAGAALLKYLAARALPLSHCAGFLALAALLAVPGLSHVALQLAATVILLTVAIWEYAALRGGLPDRLRR